MKSKYLAYVIASCFTASFILGCGGGEELTTVEGDEISRYLAEHPELVEAAEAEEKLRNEKSEE
jgi:hypothetical protein